MAWLDVARADALNLFLIEQNILHFERLLASNLPPSQRATVTELLLSQRRDLAEFSRTALDSGSRQPDAPERGPTASIDPDARRTG